MILSDALHTKLPDSSYKIHRNTLKAADSLFRMVSYGTEKVSRCKIIIEDLSQSLVWVRSYKIVKDITIGSSIWLFQSICTCEVVEEVRGLY